MAHPAGEARKDLTAEAADWLARLDSGSADIDEFELWRSVPRHAAAFAEVNAMWARADVLKFAAIEEPPRTAPAFSRRALLAGGATAIAAGIAATAVIMPLDRWSRSELATSVGERRSFRFPDGSTADLNTDTLLYWLFDGRNRRVWLERGEVAFRIVSDAVRPFTLYHGGAAADLSAGRFNIRLTEVGLDLLVLAGKAVAQVADGRVHADVSENAVAKLVRLEDRQGRVIEAPEREVQSAESWPRGEVVFDGMDLDDAVAEYNRYLTQPISVKDAATGRIRLGGRFMLSDLDGFLRALDASFDVRAERGAGGKIILARR